MLSEALVVVSYFKKGIKFYNINTFNFARVYIWSHHQLIVKIFFLS